MCHDHPPSDEPGSPHPPEPLSRRGFLKVAGIGLAAGIGGPIVALPAAASLPGIALTQLHLHATTNHNANYAASHNGSIQWQSWMGRHAPGMTPYDVLWWSEHRHAYDQSSDFFIRLETGTIDPSTWTLYGMRPFDVANEFLRAMAERGCCGGAHSHEPSASIDPRYYAERMAPTVSGDAAALSCALPGNDFWEIRLTNPQTPGTTTVTYVPLSEPPKSRELGSFFLPRPLFSEVSLRLDCYRSSDADGQGVEIEVQLSDHVRETEAQYNTHSILYQFVEQDQVSDPILTDEETQIRVQVNLPPGGNWDTGWTTLVLPLSQHARRLIPGSEEGIDNVIQQIYFRLRAPQGTAVTFGMRRPTLVSAIPDDQANWEKGKSLSEGYQRMGHRSYSGCEVGNLRRGTHVNAFLPTGAGNAIPPLEMDSSQVAAWAAGLGGIASYNHPFGAFNGDVDPNQEQRTRDLASALLENDVDGCRLLEVGYLVRGAVDFEHHVKLWDYLLTDGRTVYGVGAHDRHGQVWEWDSPAGAFGTWVHFAGDLTQDSLLAGLQSGRLYFGNPWQMDGAFDLSVNGVNMGGSVVVAPGARFRITIDLPAWADHPDWIVTLKLFAITHPDPQTAEPVFFSRSFKSPIANFNLRMPRGFDLYLRLEVQLDDGPDYWARTPVAWGNPVWVKRG